MLEKTNNFIDDSNVESNLDLDFTIDDSSTGEKEINSGTDIDLNLNFSLEALVSDALDNTEVTEPIARTNKLLTLVEKAEKYANIGNVSIQAQYNKIIHKALSELDKIFINSSPQQTMYNNNIMNISASDLKDDYDFYGFIDSGDIVIQNSYIEQKERESGIRKNLIKVLSGIRDSNIRKWVATSKRNKEIATDYMKQAGIDNTFILSMSSPKAFQVDVEDCIEKMAIELKETHKRYLLNKSNSYIEKLYTYAKEGCYSLMDLETMTFNVQTGEQIITCPHCGKKSSFRILDFSKTFGKIFANNDRNALFGHLPFLCECGQITALSDFSIQMLLNGMQAEWLDETLAFRSDVDSSRTVSPSLPLLKSIKEITIEGDNLDTVIESESHINDAIELASISKEVSKFNICMYYKMIKNTSKEKDICKKILQANFNSVSRFHFNCNFEDVVFSVLATLQPVKHITALKKVLDNCDNHLTQLYRIEKALELLNNGTSTADLLRFIDQMKAKYDLFWIDLNDVAYSKSFHKNIIAEVKNRRQAIKESLQTSFKMLQTHLNSYIYNYDWSNLVIQKKDAKNLKDIFSTLMTNNDELTIFINKVCDAVLLSIYSDNLVNSTIGRTRAILTTTLNKEAKKSSVYQQTKSGKFSYLTDQDFLMEYKENPFETKFGLTENDILNLSTDTVGINQKILVDLIQTLDIAGTSFSFFYSLNLLKQIIDQMLIKVSDNSILVELRNHISELFETYPELQLPAPDISAQTYNKYLLLILAGFKLDAIPIDSLKHLNINANQIVLREDKESFTEYMKRIKTDRNVQTFTTLQFECSSLAAIRELIILVNGWFTTIVDSQTNLSKYFLIVVHNYAIKRVLYDSKLPEIITAADMTLNMPSNISLNISKLDILRNTRYKFIKLCDENIEPVLEEDSNKDYTFTVYSTDLNFEALKTGEIIEGKVFEAMLNEFNFDVSESKDILQYLTFLELKNLFKPNGQQQEILSNVPRTHIDTLMDYLCIFSIEAQNQSECFRNYPELKTSFESLKPEFKSFVKDIFSYLKYEDKIEVQDLLEVVTDVKF